VGRKPLDTQPPTLNCFRSATPDSSRRSCTQTKALRVGGKSNEGGLSRDQTSLYTKIDIFFPVHGKGDYVGAQSETNVKCLDTNPLPFDSTCLFVLRAPARWRHRLRRLSRAAHVVVCEHRKKERL